jgi:type VI secretion system secreted protein VgrG
LSDKLTIAQAPRLLRIDTPLGSDAVVLRRLRVREAIGTLFHAEAEILSTNEDLQPTSLIGKTVTCSVMNDISPERHFHGMVRSFARIGPHARGVTGYRIELAPRLWNLSRTSDCRIFQDATIKDIASTLFVEHQVAPVRWGAAVSSTRRPYCVQFNETDLEFVQRILDENGYGYFFAHSENDHTLTVCGSNSDFPLVPGNPQVVWSRDERIDGLSEWQPISALQPGAVRAQDFDGLKLVPLNAQANTILNTPAPASLEIYNWPGGQAVRPDIVPSKLEMEELEAGADLISARGRNPSVFAGGRLRVLSGLDAKQPVTFLIREVIHEAHDETHLGGDGSAAYTNSLVLMPGDRIWRQPTPRRRPIMAGIHNALVTGPSGEEIYCDEYGRVKLHFLWDRAGPKDDSSSCWVRVAQGVAGRWGGSWMLPRVGDEVLVAFLNGDPDRPVVIGSVFNAEQKPLYALPTNKTQSGIRTRSSKGGTSSNFNELRFEDKKGSEEISVQAERDMTLRIKNDRTETIDGKHTETVKLDRSTIITQGNDTLVAKAGDISAKAPAGKIELEAMQSITLVCGQSKISITPASINIQSTTVTVTGTAKVATQAPMAQHSGDGMLTLKGGLVQIN